MERNEKWNSVKRFQNFKFLWSFENTEFRLIIAKSLYKILENLN